MNKKKQNLNTSRKILILVVCILFFEKVEQTVECIKSFLLSNVNIYVLNNSFSPLAQSILGEFCKNCKQIKIFDSDKNSGAKIGKNFLINNTKEQWLFFADSDIVVKTKDWLQIPTNHISEHSDNATIVLEIGIPNEY